MAPELTWSILMAIAGLTFLWRVTLRLAAAREPVPAEPTLKPSRTEDQDLPAYTLIIALYREQRVLARLVEALTALDYPAAKLDIKLVVEADDEEMHEAFSAITLPGSFQVIVAPPGAPRTKPRALNVALPFAGGDYVTVYDAEDVPHPNQIRLAVETFARVPLDVACLQARLVIDNTDDSWITRLFTIEYATLFDVINPGLTRLDMLVPLGGTSNHFRKSVLQRLGGWDAWSVTEDAELGIRLAVAGYRVADLPSATLEEAPATLKAWMKQRTRWMKGFMQVCITHSRKPLRTWRSLGTARFFGAVTMTFGTAVAALGYPFFTLLSIKGLVDQSLFRAETLLEAMSSALGVILFVSGLVAIIVPALAALQRPTCRCSRSTTSSSASPPGAPYGSCCSTVPLEQDGARARANLPHRHPQRCRRRSRAASAGARSRLKALTKRPFLSMR
jgi:cellulose synthase/poly-beta-1,6-N-acetylglucosamine synthase-like glycosyltransferase